MSNRSRDESDEMISKSDGEEQKKVMSSPHRREREGPMPKDTLTDPKFLQRIHRFAAVHPKDIFTFGSVCTVWKETQTNHHGGYFVLKNYFSDNQDTASKADTVARMISLMWHCPRMFWFLTLALEYFKDFPLPRDCVQRFLQGFPGVGEAGRARAPKEVVDAYICLYKCYGNRFLRDALLENGYCRVVVPSICPRETSIAYAMHGLASPVVAHYLLRHAFPEPTAEAHFHVYSILFYTCSYSSIDHISMIVRFSKNLFGSAFSTGFFGPARNQPILNKAAMNRRHDSVSIILYLAKMISDAGGKELLRQELRKVTAGDLSCVLSGVVKYENFYCLVELLRQNLEKTQISAVIGHNDNRYGNLIFDVLASRCVKILELYFTALAGYGVGTMVKWQLGRTASGWNPRPPVPNHMPKSCLLFAVEHRLPAACGKMLVSELKYHNLFDRQYELLREKKALFHELGYV